MKLSRIARVGAIGAIAALALTACAANEPAPGGNGSTDEPAGLAGDLVGAGASSQEVAVQAWSAGFQTANPDVTVNYDPAGSGAGRDSFQAGAVTFAGSDRAFTIEEIEEGPFDGCAADSPIIQLPTYVSPIAVVFNLEGVESLNLDAASIAGLFSGSITNWNDPAIVEQNPDATLPDLAVAPVHRSDDSGTTENFTEYLFATAPDVWTSEPDGVWPLSSGEAAQGTSGVISAVQGGQGTITYADASRAGEEGLASVSVLVGEEYVPYSPEAAAAIVDASPFEDGRTDGDLAVAIDRTSEEAGVYPIVLIAYMIACEQYEDPATAELVSTFFSYVASSDGQDEAASAAGSAPITDSARAAVETAIALIQ